MITCPFALHVPADLGDALELIGRYGNAARPLSGGTVLLPEMSRGTIVPDAVVDLAHCGLNTVRREHGHLSVGATVTYRQLEREDGLLGKFARSITGGPQIRNRATIGGSAAWANPSSDVPAVLVALKSLMVMASTSGERRVPAEEFFIRAFHTAVAPGELLISIEVPDDHGMRYGYNKLKFGESSWPIVTAAAVVHDDGNARVAIGGATPTPFAVEVNDRDELPAAVAAALIDPWSDILADGDYRRQVAAVIARRAADEAYLS